MESDIESIYSSPEAEPELKMEEHRGTPELVVEHLRVTRPWVKFCSISGFITAFFLVIIGFLIPSYFGDSIPTPYSHILVIFHTILAILFTILALRLSAYEKSITRLVITRHLDDLEMTIAHQYFFWKQLGLMVLILVVIYLTAMILSLFFIVNS